VYNLVSGLVGCQSTVNYSTHVVIGCQALSIEIGVYNEARVRVYILARARGYGWGDPLFEFGVPHVCSTMLRTNNYYYFQNCTNTTSNNHTSTRENTPHPKNKCL
jgi:hypothetical protein